MKTTLDELMVFITIVDSGSITAAAEHLNQTVSGISRTLNRLEKKLKVTLLERTTRTWNLTNEGRYFLDKARFIIATVHEAEENVFLSDKKPEGDLRISAAYPFIKHIILPLLPEFQRIYPNIYLQINSDDLIIDLLENKTDIAIRIGNLKDSTLHAKMLGKSQLRILASPEYLKQHGTPKTIQDLKKHKLLGFSRNNNLNIWPIMDQKHLFSISPYLCISNGELIRELAVGGYGIACLSDFMTAQDRSKDNLIELFQESLVLQYQNIYAVYYKQNHLAARVQCFINFLAERFEKISKNLYYL